MTLFASLLNFLLCGAYVPPQTGANYTVQEHETLHGAILGAWRERRAGRLVRFTVAAGRLFVCRY